MVTASGLFASAKPLDIEGADRFGGEILHTTEWNGAHSAAGKAVAVIGNGSTGVQLLSRIAAEASQVHVYQRTPQWITPRPRYGQPIDEATRWLLRTMPYYWNWTRLSPLITQMGTYSLLVPDPEWQRAGGHFNRPNDAAGRADRVHQGERRLEDLWQMERGGPRAFAGLTVPGFPNLFMLYGPNSQPQSIVLMLEQGHQRMEVTQRAFDDYNTAMDERAAGMIWSDPGSVKQNYYVSETGRLPVSNPWRDTEFFSYLQAPWAADYDFG